MTRSCLEEIDSLRLNGKYDKAINDLENIYNGDASDDEVKRVLSATYYDKALSFWHRFDKYYLIALVSEEDAQQSMAYLEKAKRLSSDISAIKMIDDVLNKCHKVLKKGLSPLSSPGWKANKKHIGRILPLIPQPDLTKKETWIAAGKAGVGLGLGFTQGKFSVDALEKLFEARLKYTQFEHAIHYIDHITSGDSLKSIFASKYSEYGWGLYKGSLIKNSDGSVAVKDDWDHLCG